ncbi:JAB domain-containing protein [Pseudalkalibacillus sp. A8]|uniref:JAB domain-containing protein n=1 Tax=Pseudalkalibacillus sp. A8 TaxID=3382641 RepID=UPI0038B46B0C
MSNWVIHPREVLKTAMLNNAPSTIVAHHHPSQDVTSSWEDIDVLKRKNYLSTQNILFKKHAFSQNVVKFGETQTLIGQPLSF